MGVIEQVRGILVQNIYNIYIERIVCALVNCVLRREKEFHALLQTMGTMDYFQDVSFLKEFRRKYDSDRYYGNRIRPKGTGLSYGYGILHTVFPWEDIKKLDELFSVEHGINLYEDAYKDIRLFPRTSCITFSSFRKAIIQSKVDIPVFCIGPYIRYVNSFYTEDSLRQMKKHLGKTLIVFPGHSTDQSEKTTNLSLFLQTVKKWAMNYNSVLVNTFWWNINDPLIEALASEGYQIISCGWLFDPYFLARLKDYIYLSDMAIGDSIGTHIGYCIDGGVPFSYEELDTNFVIHDIEKKIQVSRERHERRIRETFRAACSIGAQAREVCNFYWGSDSLKTREELRAIAEISRDLLRVSRGFRSRLYKASAVLLREYREADGMKYRLLLDALPPNFLKERQYG